MQRTIKFRAWDKRQKQMSSPFSLVELTQYEHIFETMFKHLARFNDLIWLQYTGLKDSFNDEEYFGDIVKDSNEENWFIDDHNSAAIVFENATTKKRRYYWEMLAHTIIGNIHSNPELVKQ